MTETEQALLVEFAQTCAELRFSLSDESDPADQVQETATALCEKLGIVYDQTSEIDYCRDPRLRAGARRMLTRDWVGPVPPERLAGYEPTGTGLSAL